MLTPAHSPQSSLRQPSADPVSWQISHFESSRRRGSLGVMRRGGGSRTRGIPVVSQNHHTNNKSWSTRRFQRAPWVSPRLIMAPGNELFRTNFRGTGSRTGLHIIARLRHWQITSMRRRSNQCEDNETTPPHPPPPKSNQEAFYC